MLDYQMLEATCLNDFAVLMGSVAQEDAEIVHVEMGRELFAAFDDPFRLETWSLDYTVDEKLPPWAARVWVKGEPSVWEEVPA
jgi:hypothetical protein